MFLRRPLRPDFVCLGPARLDGMIHYRGEEIAQSARMLTILALYYSYSGDAALLLELFPKAQGIAGWLIGRRSLSLGYERDDLLAARESV